MQCIPEILSLANITFPAIEWLMMEEFSSISGNFPEGMSRVYHKEFIDKNSWCAVCILWQLSEETFLNGTLQENKSSMRQDIFLLLYYIWHTITISFYFVCSDKYWLHTVSIFFHQFLVRVRQINEDRHLVDDDTTKRV